LLEMAEMANPVYFSLAGKGGQPYNYPAGQDLNLNDTYTIENGFMHTKQVPAQLRSPTQQYQCQRHDSLFSYTPPTDCKPGDPSPHQAETQPCFSATPMTLENYPLLPVDMSQSNSQYTMPSDRQQRHGQNSLSYGDGTGYGVVKMSRSSTHQSTISAGYQERQAAPQPRATQAQLDFTSRATPSSIHTDSTMHMRRNSALATEYTANSLYDHGTGEIRSASMAEPNDLARVPYYIDREQKTWGRFLANNE
jgi:hypothetical protein